ncbi:MAG: efflux RND transporter periplasmic adaptor subunit [Planctomycetes bacterium]|nr:efflux RND transporter periplasmic adaptor subunit [Planctomycetota bacterium]
MNSTPDRIPVDSDPPRKRNVLVRMISMFFLIVMPLVVLGAGIVVAVIFVVTAPKAEKKAPVGEAQLVTVTTVRSGNHRVVVKAMGTVVPAKRITLQPRVSGQLIEVSDRFIPGGRFDSGETIVKIDHEDYDFVVKQRTADVVRAKHDLKIEQGQQIIAKREYELIVKTQSGGVVDRDLILRKPQLELTEAAVAAAQAALDKAKLDRKRTTLTAPFNAVVLDKQEIDIGSQVSQVTKIAVLAGTDEFWVLASVPISSLKWMGISESRKLLEGSAVRIFNKTSWPENAKRIGRIAGLLSTLETQGRLARVLVSVKDPLCLKATDPDLPKLLVGMYVSLEADGVELANKIRIDRTSLRDDDTVWVFGKGGLLEIRKVTVKWRDRDYVYVDEGLKDGQRIVTSDLAVRVSGAPLKINAPISRPGDSEK